MINGKNIIAVCSSRIYDHQLHNFLELLNRYLLDYNCRTFIYALNSDLYWWENPVVPESYVFDIIPFDQIECLVIMDEKIKSRTVVERIIPKAKAHSVPIVVIDGTYDNTVSISYDYDKGFESIVRHVIEDHGARKPHFMAGIKDNKFSDARIEIFRKVLEENGMPFDRSTMVSYGEFWSDPARIATEKIIESGNIPDAVICANDIMAINVADVFVKAGISVPEQVIVTGFDGIEETLLSTPMISTAGCDSLDLAEAVGKSIAGMLDGKPLTDSFVLPKLQPNASCGCAYEPPASSTLDSINNVYYRYQDNLREFHDISSGMHQAPSPEKAAEFLNNGLTHDLCVVVDMDCFESNSNYFLNPEKNNELCVFYDSYKPYSVSVPFALGDVVPDIEMRLESGYPLIFNALDYMGKAFGYICYTFNSYHIAEYTKTADITNTIAMGIGGYINMRHQKFLTEKITAELRVAAQMQVNMMPTDFSGRDRYEICASMIPAKNVGGDFYDFFQIDADHLGLVIADVSGKGVPAALFMATSKLIINERALLPGTPAEILHDVNNHICENNKMSLFVTMWFGILDLKTGIVKFANAGHEYPAVKTGNGKFGIVKTDNLPPVGVVNNMVYEDNTIDLSGGGSLFLYTDGVTDVKNTEGEHFGLDRTLDLLNSIKADTPAEIIRGMNAGVDTFGENLERFDDTTMMCIRYKG